MTFCWKYSDHSLNNCEGLTQWDFVTLGKTLTYTTSNLNNLSNCLESNQCIDGNRCNNKNWHPRHGLPQTCGGRKFVCQVWMRPTDNFQKHSLWSNKYYTHKSKSTKEGLKKELGGYFRPREAINLSKQLWTPSRHPHHDLPQTCRGSKSVCPVWIWPMKNFLTYTGTSLKINRRWSDQCEQIGQQ